MNKEVLASHVADIEAGMKEYMPEETFLFVKQLLGHNRIQHQ